MKAMGKNQTYPAVFTPAEEGGFDVSFPRFPGCFTSGENYEEAVANATEALSAYLNVLRQEEPEVLSVEETGWPIIADINIRKRRTFWNIVKASGLDKGLFKQSL